MKDSKYESDKNFIDYLFDGDLSSKDSSWKTKAKDISWNASSTKNVSLKSLDSLPFDYNDIKKYSKESVISLMNKLYEIEEDKNHRLYQGPLGINLLILEKKSESIRTSKLKKFLKSKEHLNPNSFFKYYNLIVEILSYCSFHLNKKTSNITDFDLYEKNLFTKFLSENKLANTKINQFKKIYQLYFPNDNNLIFSYLDKKSEEDVNHVLLLRHLNVIRKYCTKESLNRRKRDYNNFLKWLTSIYVEFKSFSVNSLPLHLVTKEHLEEYKAFLLQQVNQGIYKKHTLSDVFYNIRSLFDSLYQMKLIPRDITKEVKGIKFEKYRYRELPSNQQLSDFFDLVKIYTPDPIKFSISYKLMLYLGFRIKEVAFLESCNINFGTQTIVIKGEGKKYDILPFPDLLFEDLNSITNLNKKYVFCENPRTFKNELYNYYKLLTFILDWNTVGGVHLFRHTFISRLSENPNLPPQLIQALSRHKRPDTTSLYIHRNDESLNNAVNSLNYF